MKKTTVGEQKTYVLKRHFIKSLKKLISDPSKYLFIRDETQNLSTYFRYTSKTIFHADEDYKNRLLHFDMDQSEDLRVNLVKCMREGVTMVIDLDFFEDQVLKNHAKFPTKQVFNRKVWNQPAVHKTVVDEDKDHFEEMKKGFNIILTSSTEEEQHMQDMLKKLETNDFADFEKFALHNDKDISDDSDEEVPEAVKVEAEPEKFIKWTVVKI